MTSQPANQPLKAPWRLGPSECRKAATVVAMHQAERIGCKKMLSGGQETGGERGCQGEGGNEGVGEVE